MAVRGLAHGPQHGALALASLGAEVSPRTFFNYFPSKEAVLGSDLKLAQEVCRKVLAQPPSLTPLTNVLKGELMF
jgi:AcrR family transcriptional regulator